jgi:hypothetical protein
MRLARTVRPSRSINVYSAPFCQMATARRSFSVT